MVDCDDGLLSAVTALRYLHLELLLRVCLSYVSSGLAVSAVP